MAATAGQKLDLMRERPQHFKGRRRPELVQLGPARYLTLEGTGPPDAEAFRESLSALRAVASELRAQQKRRGLDYKRAVLEALWWCGPERDFADPERLMEVPRAAWRWKVLTMVPDFVEASRVERAIARACLGRPRASEVRLEVLREGLCAQILKVGLDEDGHAFSALREMLAREGLHAYGPRHEIYLNDPLRSERAKVRTTLRHCASSY